MKVTIVIVNYAITFIFTSSLNILGCGCSTVVENTLHDQKIMASNPAGTCFFVFSTFLLLV